MITFNDTEYSRDVVEKAAEVAPGLTRRALASNRAPSASLRSQAAFGQQYGGDREIWDVLGYDRDVDAEQYRAKYQRQDIAAKVVKLPAEDTWRYSPSVSDDLDAENTTGFERDVQRLVDEAKLFHYMRRADTVAGIGEFGVLLVGLRDGQPLDEPPNQAVLSGPSDVAFFTPFAQDSVDDWLLGKDGDRAPTDPRYNRPVEYTIDFADVDDTNGSDLRDVHWQRVFHIAEGKDDSDLKGTPRLRPIYNRLEDLEKTVGASAEMFWAGADRKLHFDISSDNSADIPDDELDDLDEEVQKLVHDMQSHIKTFNTDINVIDGQEVDPSGIVDELLKFIAGATGIPKRVLTGSERGELASSQDRATWFGRIETRQNTFAEPMILRPVLDRFVEWSVLSDPIDGSYVVQWPNLFELTEVEQSEVVNNRAQAVSRIAPQGNTDLLGTPEELFAFIADGEKPDFEDRAEIELLDERVQRENFQELVDQ